jgi:hypothetical protein
MKATFKTVNATGISEIKEFLANNHKKGGDHFDVGMLSAWAKYAPSTPFPVILKLLRSATLASIAKR